MSGSRYATPVEFKECKCAPWRRTLSNKAMFISALIVMLLSFAVTLAIKFGGNEKNLFAEFLKAPEEYVENRNLVVYVSLVLSTLYFITASIFKIANRNAK